MDLYSLRIPVPVELPPVRVRRSDLARRGRLSPAVHRKYGLHSDPGRSFAGAFHTDTLKTHPRPFLAIPFPRRLTFSLIGMRSARVNVVDMAANPYSTAVPVPVACFIPEHSAYAHRFSLCKLSCGLPKILPIPLQPSAHENLRILHCLFIGDAILVPHASGNLA
jgi:hypothetical protein